MNRSTVEPLAVGSCVLLAVVEAEGGLIPTSPEVRVGGDDTVTVAYTKTAADGTPMGVFLRAFEISSGSQTCETDGATHCLNGGRFQVRVSWRDFADNTGVGQAVSLTDDTGYFWFFSEDNVELGIKVLDASVINQRHWVFYGALSNVEYDITVTDTQTGQVRTYTNPSGSFGGVGDTDAFPAP